MFKDEELGVLAPERCGKGWIQGKMIDDRVQCHLSHAFSKVGKRCELSVKAFHV
jgi:hypothetical protein